MKFGAYLANRSFRDLTRDRQTDRLHLHLTPLMGLIPFEFSEDVWQQKLESLSYRAALLA